MKRLLIIAFFLIFSVQTAQADTYKSEGVQIELPEDWLTVPLFLGGLRAYTLLSYNAFYCIEVTHCWIEGETIKTIRKFLNREAVREDFKADLLIAYEKDFDNVQFDVIEVAEISDELAIHVVWSGFSKKGYLLRNNQGQKIYFSEYFLPHHHNWLKTSIITFASTESIPFFPEIFSSIEFFYY